MPITIISGTPGSGKTSLARMLSASASRGVHVESDVFFRFLAHRIDPSLPEASDQNSIVVRAYVAAALEYSAAGYDVYLDGVIGPWLLPLIRPMTPEFEYVLLHAPLDVVLARGQGRADQASASQVLISRMHEQFSGIPAAFRKHVIQTDGKSIEEVANEFRVGRRSGAYTLTA